jgi:3-hydroxyisobutyrate dehydrogenase-like beta-hydroxyacid dehydrogenase
MRWRGPFAAVPPEEPTVKAIEQFNEAIRTVKAGVDTLVAGGIPPPQAADIATKLYQDIQHRASAPVAGGVPPAAADHDEEKPKTKKADK